MGIIFFAGNTYMYYKNQQEDIIRLQFFLIFLHHLNQNKKTIILFRIGEMIIPMSQEAFEIVADAGCGSTQPS